MTGTARLSTRRAQNARGTPLSPFIQSHSKFIALALALTLLAPTASAAIKETTTGGSDGSWLTRTWNGVKSFTSSVTTTVCSIPVVSWGCSLISGIADAVTPSGFTGPCPVGCGSDDDDDSGPDDDGDQGTDSDDDGGADDGDHEPICIIASGECDSQDDGGGGDDGGSRDSGAFCALVPAWLEPICDPESDLRQFMTNPMGFLMNVIVSLIAWAVAAPFIYLARGLDRVFEWARDAGSSLGMKFYSAFTYTGRTIGGVIESALVSIANAFHDLYGGLADLLAPTGTGAEALLGPFAPVGVAIVYVSVGSIAFLAIRVSMSVVRGLAPGGILK